MELQKFNDSYLVWLADRMDGVDHLLLFEKLHNILFRWMPDVPMDENRVEDGRRLRFVFESDTGIDIPKAALDWPTSFLEVLVALAETMEDNIMYNPDNDTDASTWFWMMLSNIGLAQCDDIWMEKHEGSGFYVQQVVDDVMLRRYGRDGEGGLFPLERPREDQRKVQLWYQMNSYILEKNWV